MRIALGLDVDAVPSFAAALPLEPGARASAVLDSGVGDPDPRRIDSIIDATRAVIADATEREGEAPASVALVHPLAWDAGQVQRLHRALARAGLSDVLVLTSAAAVAIGIDAPHPVANGRRVTVVALRPDGAEVQTLRKDGEHSFRELGAPISVDGVTEGELDAALLALVEAKLPGRLPASRDDPALQVAFAALGDAVHLAREKLCSEESAIVGVRLPGRAAVIQVQRDDFHVAARPLVASMLPALLEAIRASGASAGGTDQLVLTGTSAPTPLLAEMLGSGSRVPVAVAGLREGGAFAAAWAAAALAVTAQTPTALAPTVQTPTVLAPTALTLGVPAPAAEAPTLPTAEVQPVQPVGVAAVDPVVPASAAAAARDEFGGEGDPPTERERRPLTLLRLWPITAAAAVLVALAGTASSGVLDLTPAGSHPTTPATDPAGRMVDTAPDASSSEAAEPTPGPTASVPADSNTNGGTTTKKKSGTKGTPGTTTPGTPASPASPSVTPGSTPTPTVTPTPTPTPTGTPTPTVTPTPTPTPAPTFP